MCGRFDLHTSVHEFVRLLQAALLYDPAPSYNIAPTQQVAVLRVNRDDQRELVAMRWGLVPSWSKGPDNRYSMINARAETLPSKPAYRGPFKSRRCLIPADGFFEWQRGPAGKRPYYIGVGGQQPFAMAGLWEAWTGSNGDRIESCTIITTEANSLIAGIHHRMPVILEPQNYDQWLDHSQQQNNAARALLEPFPVEPMFAHPVSVRVNNAANNEPACIEPEGED
jgi:putative SOS response-associated peptidase YedK